jgi:hypothetical protein
MDERTAPPPSTHEQKELHMILIILWLLGLPLGLILILWLIGVSR